MTVDIHGTGAQRPRVLALAVDAPNHALLLQWMDEGKLPHLSKLRMKSQVFTLLSEKRFSNEHCWIPVLTGRKRERWSHWLDAWDPKTYQFKEASLYDWIQAPMFYALGERRQVVAFDLAAPVVERVSGVQITGFAVELNECYPQSQPPGLLEDLLSIYGADPKLKQHHRVVNGVSQREGLSWIVPSCYRPEQMQSLIDALKQSVKRRTAACIDLMQSQPWDLFFAAYSEIHTAGHSLWHLSQLHPLSVLRQGSVDPMLEIYQAVDESLGLLMETAGSEVNLVFFTLDATVVDSLENFRAVFLPEFLYRWNFQGRSALACGDMELKSGPLRLDYQEHWKHEVWALRTAHGERDLESPMAQEARGDPLSWCPGNWYAPCWSRMRAFALPSVADGGVRLNVKGREAQGQVDPGDFLAECERLTRDLMSITNPRNGRPVVREVIRVRDDPMDSDSGKPPADLTVVCYEEGPLDTVDIPLFGRIGPIPYFRTSSHQAHGQSLQNLALIYRPGQASAASDCGVAALEDVPATVLALLGEPLPKEFDGRSLLTPSSSGGSL